MQSRGNAWGAEIAPGFRDDTETQAAEEGQVVKLRFGYLLLGGALASAPAFAQPKPAAFGACAACHTVVKGAKPGIGPNLFGIGGRKAGTAPNFRFSAPMAKSGITWTRDNLVSFIQKPQKAVPGTKMAFGGVSNPASAAAIADYLLATK